MGQHHRPHQRGYHGRHAGRPRWQAPAAAVTLTGVTAAAIAATAASGAPATAAASPGSHDPTFSNPTIRLTDVTASYIVKSGDTLSAIAAARWGDAAAWPALWWANRQNISNPNVIEPGQVLTIGSPAVTTAMTQAAHAALAGPAAPVTTTASAPPPPPETQNDQQGQQPAQPQDQSQPQPQAAQAQAPAQQGTAPLQAPAQPQPQAPAQSQGTVSAAPGSFQACVISRESGGNPTAVNPSSGAGGLYQFLPSTWASLGFSGLPQDASVATQNAAFAKAFAEFGTQPWAPSDGC